MLIEKTRFETVRGDITRTEGVEAIVNAANCSLRGGGGVDGAIHRAAGPELLRECESVGGCPTGEARITGAYALGCRYVIHTVGPVWRGGGHGEDDLLGGCYRNSLALAERNGVRSLAFPSVSTGVYGFPVDRAADIAVREISGYIKEHPDAFDLVLMVLFSDRDLEIYCGALARLG